MIKIYAYSLFRRWSPDGPQIMDASGSPIPDTLVPGALSGMRNDLNILYSTFYFLLKLRKKFAKVGDYRPRSHTGPNFENASKSYDFWREIICYIVPFNVSLKTGKIRQKTGKSGFFPENRIFPEKFSNGMGSIFCAFWIIFLSQRNNTFEDILCIYTSFLY